MDEIFKIANQLHAQGQTPTTALIKARLTKSVPIPMIISALQRWKQNPDKFKTESQEAENTSAENSQQTMSQDQQIAELQEQVAQLQRQVSQLARRLSMLEIS